MKRNFRLIYEGFLFYNKPFGYSAVEKQITAAAINDNHAASDEEDDNYSRPSNFVRNLSIISNASPRISLTPLGSESSNASAQNSSVQRPVVLNSRTSNLVDQTAFNAIDSDADDQEEEASTQHYHQPPTKRPLAIGSHVMSADEEQDDDDDDDDEINSPPPKAAKSSTKVPLIPKDKHLKILPESTLGPSTGFGNIKYKYE